MSKKSRTCCGYDFNNQHYRYWHNKDMKFWCCGLLAFPPDMDEFFEKSGIRGILQFCVLLMSLACWPLIMIKLDFEYNWIAVIVICSVLVLSTILAYLVLLFHSGCTDPGYISRNADHRCNTESERRNSDVCYMVDISQEANGINLVNINGKEMVQKFCCTCKHYIDPLTTYHCPKCRCCVDHIDHHCMFMGKCVGKRNHKSFMLTLVTFASFETFLILQMIWMVVYLVFYIIVHNSAILWNFEYEEQPFPTLMTVETVLAVIIVFISIFSMIFLSIYAFATVGMLSFHINLAATGNTTRSKQKGIGAYILYNWTCCECIGSIISYFLKCRYLKVKRSKSRFCSSQAVRSSYYHAEKVKNQIEFLEKQKIS